VEWLKMEALSSSPNTSKKKKKKIKYKNKKAEGMVPEVEHLLA
jgi:hypothetical protein